MSIQCDFSLLDSNLCAIAERGTSNLVANPSNRSLDRSWSIQGRIWTWYYDTCSLFGANPQEQKLLSILEAVKKEFDLCLQYLKDLNSRYRRALDHDPAGAAKDSAERDIAYVAEKFSFLSERRTLFSPPEAFQTIQAFFTDKTGKNLVGVEQFELLECFSKDYALTTIATLLQLPYPVQSFRKFFDKEGLEPSEKKAIDQWVAAVQHNKHRLNVWLLHYALTGLCELFHKKLRTVQDLKIADIVGIFEWKLFQIGLHFLAEQDPKHLEWASTIRPNETKIQCSGQEFSIGNKKKWEALEEYNGSIYEINNNPTLLLFIAPNPVLLGMWQTVCQFEADDIYPVTIVHKDSTLRYCLIECVDLPLSDIQWQSRDKLVAESDRPYANRLAELIQWFSESGIFPKKLPIALFFFQKRPNRHDFRAILPVAEGAEGSFLRLEKFALDSAKGNRFIFRHLMHQSKLMDHPVADFFREVMQSRALGFDDTNITREAIFRGISDKSIVDQAKKAAKETDSVLTPILERLFKKLKREDLLPRLQQLVCSHFLNWQKDSGYVSSLNPDFHDQEAIKSFEREIVSQNSSLFL